MDAEGVSGLVAGSHSLLVPASNLLKHTKSSSSSSSTMYKTKVQELCQRRSWTLPDYQTFRDGPAHNPRYTSTVTVNGLQFQTPQPTRSSKEAQNNAAKLAFNHFSQPNSSDPNPYPYPHPHPSPSFSLSDRFVSATPSSSGSSGPNNGGVGSGVSQPRLVGCQTSQSSSTVPATATVDDQKSDFITLNFSLVSLINLTYKWRFVI
ncbi:hypothetical protein RIF29_19697 [Crotalaria pallida]|uniref:DRBM domain-containing protein n=1 Tax=Crotalaria pallida TaxID=3830 RepID=A0AAN9F894_CROPI